MVKAYNIFLGNMLLLEFLHNLVFVFGRGVTETRCYVLTTECGNRYLKYFVSSFQRHAGKLKATSDLRSAAVK